MREPAYVTGSTVEDVLLLHCSPYPSPTPLSASVSLPVSCQVNAEVRFLLARLDFTDFYKER